LPPRTRHITKERKWIGMEKRAYQFQFDYPIQLARSVHTFICIFPNFWPANRQTSSGHKVTIRPVQYIARQNGTLPFSFWQPALAFRPNHGFSTGANNFLINAQSRASNDQSSRGLDVSFHPSFVSHRDSRPHRIRIAGRLPKPTKINADLSPVPWRNSYTKARIFAFKHEGGDPVQTCGRLVRPEPPLGRKSCKRTKRVRLPIAPSDPKATSKPEPTDRAENARVVLTTHASPQPRTRNRPPSQIKAFKMAHVQEPLAVARRRLILPTKPLSRSLPHRLMGSRARGVAPAKPCQATALSFPLWSSSVFKTKEPPRKTSIRVWQSGNPPTTLTAQRVKNSPVWSLRFFRFRAAVEPGGNNSDINELWNFTSQWRYSGITAALRAGFPSGVARPGMISSMNCW